MTAMEHLDGVEQLLRRDAAGLEKKLSITAFQAPTLLSNVNQGVLVRGFVRKIEKVLPSQPTQEIV